MGKLIIHAGFHKTGTSAIQKTLSNNREFLWKNGYFYPDPAPFEAHHAFASRLMHTPSLEEGVKDVEEALTAFKQLAEGRTVLLSSEIFSEQIDPFCLSTVPNIFDEIQIVFYVRQQDDLRESAYNQQVKQAGEHRAIDEYRAYRWDLYDFLKGYSDAVKDSDVYALEYNNKVFFGENLVTDFFNRVLSLPYDVPKPRFNKIVNHSLSSVSCAILARLNKLPIEEQQKLKLIEILISVFPNKDFKQFSLLSDSFRKALVEKSEESNKKLRHNFLRSGDFRYINKDQIFLDGSRLNKIIKEKSIINKLSLALDDQRYDLNHILKF